ncbi:general stress protein [Fictibacillus terranigra]|uniref:General stress protein n=1 Tax=Fictibacillus terranigra TaxID=3058424 RepID=A0ABT8E5G9_9BACL|nr:general stress protein [Fictibacillus sp. CENA-BCM004]MDN4073157.1 general stress protein [Fictibacillus sp. CENA-BCM004]
MGKDVLGVYHYDEEAVSAVEQLKSDGYDIDEISFVINHEGFKRKLETKTGAAVDIVNQEETFLKKIKNLFSNDSYTNNFENKLAGLGLPENKAMTYAPELEAGKILILVGTNYQYEDKR